MTSAQSQIKSIAARVMSLDDEIKAMNGDKSEVYKEAKSNGFDVPALKAAIKRYRKETDEPDKTQEQDALVETYLAALHGTVQTIIAKAVKDGVATAKRSGSTASVTMSIADAERVFDAGVEKTPVDPVPAPANGLPDEMHPTRTHVHAHEEHKSEPEGMPDVPKFLDRRPVAA